MAGMEANRQIKAAKSQPKKQSEPSSRQSAASKRPGSSAASKVKTASQVSGSVTQQAKQSQKIGAAEASFKLDADDEQIDDESDF